MKYALVAMAAVIFTLAMELLCTMLLPESMFTMGIEDQKYAFIVGRMREIRNDRGLTVYSGFGKFTITILDATKGVGHVIGGAGPLHWEFQPRPSEEMKIYQYPLAEPFVPETYFAPAPADSLGVTVGPAVPYEIGDKCPGGPTCITPPRSWVWGGE